MAEKLYTEKIPVRRRRLTDSQKIAIRKAYVRGDNIHSIVSEFNISIRTLYNTLEVQKRSKKKKKGGKLMYNIEQVYENPDSDSDLVSNKTNNRKLENNNKLTRNEFENKTRNEFENNNQKLVDKNKLTRNEFENNNQKLVDNNNTNSNNGRTRNESNHRGGNEIQHRYVNLNDDFLEEVKKEINSISNKITSDNIDDEFERSYKGRRL